VRYAGAGGDFFGTLAGKRVLGINPPVYDFAWFDLWALPLGLMEALGACRERGCDVSLIDCVHEAMIGELGRGRRKIGRSQVERPFSYSVYKNIPRKFYRFGIDGERLRRHLTRSSPDVVFVTSIMTYWYIGVWEVISAVRGALPGVPVVLGGIYATLCPEHAEGSGADIIHSGPFPFSSPLVPIDLYDHIPFIPLITSRGCPLDCDYCASKALGGGFSERPTGEIIRDLDRMLAITSARDVALYDDALLWNRENRFYPLCEHIRASHPGVSLHTPNGLHVSCLDERCCREMKSAGFRTIRLSYEGTDPLTLAASSCKVTENDYERAVRNLTRAGYAADEIETYVLAGLPGQSAHDVERSIDFVKSLGCRPKLTEYSPIPGTRAFVAAAACNPDVISDPLLHNNTIYAQYVAGSPTPEELQALKNRTRL
jgi:radical SAM superfamily enzyme YgiQ (UPF0313 family)